MFIIFFLSYCFIISIFTIDSILPVINIIGEYFGVREKDQLQLIISVYFAFLGLGQIMLGTLSDIFGRKIMIIVSVTLFLLSTIIVLVAESYFFFIFGRALQGFCAAFGQVLTKAIIADLYRGDKISDKLSMITTIFGLGPIIAPITGTLLTESFGWQAIYIFLMMNLIILLFLTVFCFNETLTKKNKMQKEYFITGLKSIYTNYQTVYFICINTIVFTILLLVLSNLPLIFIDYYQLTKMEFSLIMTIINFAAIFGPLFNLYLIRNKNSLIALKITSCILFCCALSSLIFVYSGWMSIELFSIHIFFFFFSFIAVATNSASLAIMPQRKFAGLCSSLLGSTSLFCAGFILSIIINPIIQGLFAHFILAFLCLSSLLFFLVVSLNKSKIKLKYENPELKIKKTIENK